MKKNDLSLYKNYMDSLEVSDSLHNKLKAIPATKQKQHSHRIRIAPALASAACLMLVASGSIFLLSKTPSTKSDSIVLNDAFPYPTEDLQGQHTVHRFFSTLTLYQEKYSEFSTFLTTLTYSDLQSLSNFSLLSWLQAQSFTFDAGCCDAAKKNYSIQFHKEQQSLTLRLEDYRSDFDFLLVSVTDTANYSLKGSTRQSVIERIDTLDASLLYPVFDCRTGLSQITEDVLNNRILFSENKQETTISYGILFTNSKTNQIQLLTVDACNVPASTLLSLSHSLN